MAPALSWQPPPTLTAPAISGGRAVSAPSSPITADADKGDIRQGQGRGLRVPSQKAVGLACTSVSFISHVGREFLPVTGNHSNYLFDMDHAHRRASHLQNSSHVAGEGSQSDIPGESSQSSIWTLVLILPCQGPGHAHEKGDGLDYITSQIQSFQMGSSRQWLLNEAFGPGHVWVSILERKGLQEGRAGVSGLRLGSPWRVEQAFRCGACGVLWTGATPAEGRTGQAVRAGV
ncbi:hypothetical protein CB1_001616083 [Camelus ferus]|nr:hypothetical protein CB1_001616083 [Camelus ferus]